MTLPIPPVCQEKERPGEEAEKWNANLWYALQQKQNNRTI